MIYAFPMISKTKINKKKIYKGSFAIRNDKGLHTRPSTELVKCASRFQAQITLKSDNHNVNAKSILGILMLAATKGTVIQIEACGEDAKEAISAIEKLAKNYFHMEY